MLALPCMLLIYENKLGRKEITEKTEESFDCSGNDYYDERNYDG